MSSARDTHVKPSLNSEACDEATSKTPDSAPNSANNERSKPPPAAHDAVILGKRVASTSPPPSKKLKATTIANRSQHLDYRSVPTNWLEAEAAQDSQSTDHSSLQFTYHNGDMFADAPQGTVLIHACNIQGHWGAGIAKVFKVRYPAAFADHNKFCIKDHSKTSPVPTGTTQLLAPRDGDMQHWIGCVFTSAKYGKRKDKPDSIVRNTVASMQMLLEFVSHVDDGITEIRMCKINSGKFGVPWEVTEEALRSINLKPQWRSKIQVWEPLE